MYSNKIPDLIKQNVTIIYVIDGKEYLVLNEELKKKVEFPDLKKFHQFLNKVLNYLGGKVGIIKVYPNNIFMAYNAAGETIFVG